MKFRVVIQPRARGDIESVYVWLSDRSAEAAIEWYNELETVIGTLAVNPARCSLAPESSSFPVEIRQLLVGRRRSIYRVLFTIEKKVVSVLAVRHSARAPLDPDEE